MLWAVVAAAAVMAATSLLMSSVQGQVRTIGAEAAPQAATASDLYFALSDLDAQVARLVLIGNAEAQAGSQIDALSTYRERSLQLDADLEGALSTATTDEERGTVRELLNGLAVYRQWAWQALTVIWQAPPQPPGKLPPAALGYYGQATNVLHFELLPTAQRLRDASQARLDDAYDAQRATELVGIALVVLLGGALTILLISLQRWFGRHFRRRVNPALLLATIVTVGLVVWSAALLSVEGQRLRDAHRDSFAPYLALSHAQAISYDAAADTSRYLLSGNLPLYQQDFTRKSTCLVDGGQCGSGGDALDGGLAVLADGPVGVRKGDEVRERWLGYQRDHDRIVALADAGQTEAAIDALTGIKRGEAAFDFYYYDVAISEIATAQKQSFDVAFEDAEGLLTGWSVIPLVVFGAVILLVVAGVWPRLAEYR
ncbi:protein kinase G-activating protein GlnX [Phytohabitans flavus]|uniref:Uncharacterized protein n=2 Tax=Phytohabitans flavus TaxID=1076124 RepID=A0A6F8XPT5_9ACTN|nr:hypothetical protein Pflav_022190 [Phytohabitans flavus]